MLSLSLFDIRPGRLGCIHDINGVPHEHLSQIADCMDAMAARGLPPPKFELTEVQV